MGTKLNQVKLNTDQPIKVKKWKIREGMPVSARQLIMLYEPINASDAKQLLKYKATDVGTVKKVCVAENEIVKPG